MAYIRDCECLKKYGSNHISHILGQKPVQFFEEAADMNADGKVDITDVTELIEKLKSRK